MDKKLIIFEIPHDDIVKKDIQRVANALAVLMQTKESVEGARQGIQFVFSGYDDDPRELCEIDEVREYAKELDYYWPYHFYFLADEVNVPGIGPYSHIRLWASLLCGVTMTPHGIKYNNEDLKAFLLRHVLSLNELCSKYELGEKPPNILFKRALRELGFNV
jgi:hypothetical protein